MKSIMEPSSSTMQKEVVIHTSWSRYQWFIVTSLFLAMVIAYLDRINFSIVMPVLIKEYNISPATGGILLSMFNWSLAFFYLFAGPLIDRYHASRMLPLGVGIWSLATVFTGITSSIPLLGAMRALLGTGESTLVPSAAKIVSEVFKKEDRGKVVGIYFSGTKVGVTLGAPLAATIMVAYGWQWVFYITGAISLLWLVIWLPFYRRNKEVIPPEVSEENETQGSISWFSLLKNRSVWALILGQAGYLYVYFVFITWVPSYLVLELKMGFLKTGFLSMVPFLLAVIAGISSGWAADWWIKSGGQLSMVRKTFIGCGFILSTIFIIISAYAPTANLTVLFLILSMGSLGIASPNINSLPMDIASRRVVSSVSALQNFGGNIGGAFAPAVTGILYAWTGSFQSSLILTGVVAIVFGLGAHIFLIGKIDKKVGLNITK
jgi:MFS transporter, ACS family, D-galactonate transporter